MSMGQSLSRSASPANFSSGSDVEEVLLNDIKTIAQLCKDSALKATTSEKLVFKPRQELVDRVSLWQGDITKLDVDAIVNAANRSLLGGGGVDGAIHTAAGPKLLDECRELNGCSTGDAKITRGYRLPARHIIHAVGPVYSNRDREQKAEQLASCYRTSLEIAVENELKHVAFPSISTGVYSYPIVDATRIALNTVRVFLDTDAGNKLERVIFVVWSKKDREVYESLIPEYFPLEDKSQDSEKEPEPKKSESKEPETQDSTESESNESQEPESAESS